MKTVLLTSKNWKQIKYDTTNYYLAIEMDELLVLIHTAWMDYKG